MLVHYKEKIAKFSSMLLLAMKQKPYGYQNCIFLRFSQIFITDNTGNKIIMKDS